MSQAPPILVRPAEPTIEHGLAFANYLDTAAEGFMRLLLGRRMPELVAEAYTHPRNEYSFENVLAAERDGRIVGMAAGFGAEEQRAFSTAFGYWICRMSSPDQPPAARSRSTALT